MTTNRYFIEVKYGFTTDIDGTKGVAPPFIYAIQMQSG